VDVDTILRKEVDTPCKMPDGRQGKYVVDRTKQLCVLVPPGEGLTIDKILELTGGKLN
jgi:hypothetical protein